MDLNNNYILILLCSIVLISHLFDLFSKISRIPSVLLLIVFGILLRNICVYFNIEILSIEGYLEFLGTLGLILIVLEGTSDLKIKRQNLAIIQGSFSTALVVLLVSTSGIAMLFHLWLNADIRSAIVNAIPLGVISSAIAIPTVMNFTKHKKDFLTYEAIFSDILGIMLFNFMISPKDIHFSSLLDFILKLLIVSVLSIGGAYLLLISMNKIKTQAKFFIILSLLILIYSVGKIFHLSSLLLVFTFGIFLNNANIFSKTNFSNKTSQTEIDSGLEQFKLIISESAFLIRTFFFVVFGYTIDITRVLNPSVFKIGLAVSAILFLVRFMYLKFIIRSHVFPEIFIAPKGLVTILLFYSIPPSMTIEAINEGGVVFFVILTTGLLMLISGFSQKHLKTEGMNH